MRVLEVLYQVMGLKVEASSKEARIGEVAFLGFKENLLVRERPEVTNC